MDGVELTALLEPIVTYRSIRDGCQSVFRNIDVLLFSRLAVTAIDDAASAGIAHKQTFSFLKPRLLPSQHPMADLTPRLSATKSVISIFSTF